MRGLIRRMGAAAIVAVSAASALAHGGDMNPGVPPQDPGPPLGPPWKGPHFTQNDPEMTPGTADPQVAITRWETWWASNKEALLRLSERMQGDAPGSTPDHVRTEREIATEAKRA